MEFIEKMSKEFSHQLRNPDNHQDIIYNAKAKLREVDDLNDKIKFLTKVLEINSTLYQKHYAKCTDKENCPTNYGHETIAYFLTQELNRLGVKTDENMFTKTEKNDYEIKLEKILSELEVMAKMQQFAYDEVMTELEEMKNLYYLGKKKWQQLFLGKIVDMTAGGIISETISKSIIADFTKDFPHLLQ